MKHTPGPWDWFVEHNVDNGELSKDRPSDRCVRFLVGSNGQGFAHTVGLQHEQDEANARLIAAAPQLLECLSLANRTLQVVSLADVSGGGSAQANLNKLIELCSMTIAKATGGGE